jgi:hypothetical protein
VRPGKFDHSKPSYKNSFRPSATFPLRQIPRVLCSPKAVSVCFEAFQKKHLGSWWLERSPCLVPGGVLQVIKSDVVGGVEGRISIHAAAPVLRMLPALTFQRLDQKVFQIPALE